MPKLPLTMLYINMLVELCMQYDSRTYELGPGVRDDADPLQAFVFGCQFGDLLACCSLGTQHGWVGVEESLVCPICSELVRQNPLDACLRSCFDQGWLLAWCMVSVLQYFTCVHVIISPMPKKPNAIRATSLPVNAD